MLRWKTGLVNKAIGCWWGRYAGIKRVSEAGEDTLRQRWVTGFMSEGRRGVL